MPYNEDLARRVRNVLTGNKLVYEKKMFGGVGWLLAGNMSCGVNGDDLIVRVGPENYASALDEPHVREMDFTGRPMKGWVVVNGEGIEEDADLQRWVQRGLDYTVSLPPK